MRTVTKAIGYTVPGAIDRADALIDIDTAKPVPGPRDLLVRIRAVPVNPVDTKVRAKAPLSTSEPKILLRTEDPGLGRRRHRGRGRQRGDPVRTGEEVFYAGDISRPGTNAEYHLVDERIVGHKPKTLGWAEAAALPLTAITAWELLFDRMRVPYGRAAQSGTLLVINGAGGVGSILIQLARRLTGLTVIGNRKDRPRRLLTLAPRHRKRGTTGITLPASMG